jgi:hypothetical protein
MPTPCYLAAFVRLYRDYGLDVFGLTPVNEPDNAQAVWPSMAMSPEEQAVFIADYLAPELHAEGLDEVNIMCWDHNYSTERYPDGAFVKRLYAHDDALRAVAWVGVALLRRGVIHDEPDSRALAEQRHLGYRGFGRRLGAAQLGGGLAAHEQPRHRDAAQLGAMRGAVERRAGHERRPGLLLSAP